MSVDKFYLLNMFNRVNRRFLFLIWTLSACGCIQPRRMVLSRDYKGLASPQGRAVQVLTQRQAGINAKNRGFCHIHPDQNMTQAKERQRDLDCVTNSILNAS